jgi:trimeric autotransporter adhesin
MKRVTSVFVLLMAAALMSATIYVNDDATGANNGTSWANAFTLLQPALDSASSGDEIWVAAGTYKPTYDYGLGYGVRGNHFRLKNGVQLLGGFNGTETEVSQRNFMLNLTALSADIGIAGYSADNCYSVFYHPAGCNLDNSAVLDGFTVVWGKADFSLGRKRGAGMYNYNSSPTVRNTVFTLNSADESGGAVFNTDNSSPIFERCTFNNNSAQYDGGAICNMNYSGPEFDACMFNSNIADLSGGAISSSDHSQPVFYNSIIMQNTANSGGAIENYFFSVTTMINCNVTGNTASISGGGILSENNAAVNLYNSIIWGNTAYYGNEIFLDNCTVNIDHSCYGNDANDIYNTGTLNVTNSTTSDPMFQKFNNFDQRIYKVSPCADSGSNSYNSKPLDYDGEARIVDGTIDMGAIEWRSPMLTNPTVFVKYNASGAGTGKSWANACTTFQAGLDLAGDKYHIWAAAGTYKPTYDYGLGLGSRGNHFRMKNGVGIYGGFAGTETSLVQRNTTANPTILSGDIGTAGDNSDNCYHIIFNPSGSNLNSTAVLDGFTITKGNADLMNWPHNLGGGVYNENSAAAFTGCTIYDNTAVYGAGMYNLSSNSVIVNSLIASNASANEGGGIMNSGSQTVFTNCTVSNNSTQAFGGGIYSSSSSADELRNTIVWGNTSIKGGNEIFVEQYSTATLSYSCFGNDTDDILDPAGNGFVNSFANITDNPKFVNPAQIDFRIYGFSLCVNSGDASYNVESKDIRGEARIHGNNIDMGAYEWTDGVDPSNINAPLNVTIIVNGSGDREITWSPVYEANEYYVYRFEQPYGVFKKIAAAVSNMYIDSEIPTGNKYFYYVTAEGGK